MNKNLVIIGAGGHARVCADTARLMGYQAIVFLDDDVKNKLASGPVANYVSYLRNSDFFVGIGNNLVRETLQHKIEASDGTLVNLVHPNAVIGSNVSFGKGIAVMAGAVINIGAVIEDGAILNTCCSIDHDCHIGSFAHISVGTHLAGMVNVGKRSFLGAGVTVINNVSITDDCLIGAGAAVIKNIKVSGAYVGVPAKLLGKDENLKIPGGVRHG